MNNIAIFLVFICMTGCVNYEIPIQNENHPALSNAKSAQIELMPLLEVPENHQHDRQEKNAHFHH